MRSISHRQFGGGRNFVGDRHFCHLERPSVHVGRPFEIEDRPDAGHPNCDINHTSSPGPTECVRYDHGQVDAKVALQSRADSMGRAVGIAGEEHNPITAHVGPIDACIGANESMPVHCDHQVSPRRTIDMRSQTQQHFDNLIGCGRRQAPSALETTLWVTTRMSPSRGCRVQPLPPGACQIVARFDFGSPRTGNISTTHQLVAFATVVDDDLGQTGRRPGRASACPCNECAASLLRSHRRPRTIDDDVGE